MSEVPKKKRGLEKEVWSTVMTQKPKSKNFVGLGDMDITSASC